MTDTLDTLIRREFPAARSGDASAFGRLVAATQRMVASVALALVRDVQLSEDIAQDTFLKAWQRLGQMQHPDSFLPWLRDVARNRAIDHLRARVHRAALPDGEALLAAVIDPQAGPAELLGQAEDAAALAAALDEIPEPSREVLLLFYREGQSSRAVAGLLGLSEAAVRKRLQRARDSLQQELLARLGGAALRTAPGLAFTTAVGALLGSTPAPAAAAGLAAGSGLKTLPKLLLGAAGALLAALALMLGAVLLEVRGTLRRAASAAQRRALLRHGWVYGALMLTYVVVLWWSRQAGWDLGETLAAAGGFVIAITLLAWRRHSIERSGPGAGR